MRKLLFFVLVGFAVCNMPTFSNGQSSLPVSSLSGSQIDSLKKWIENGDSPDPYFKTALINSQQLALSSDQQKLLVTKTFEIKQLKQRLKAANTDDRVVIRNFQCIEMQKILTSNQYSSFLTLKNTLPATGDAIELWQEMLRKGLKQKSDSSMEISKIISYQLQLRNTQDQYADDIDKVQFKINEINKNNIPVSVLELSIYREYANNLNVKSLMSILLNHQDSIKLTESQKQKLKEKSLEFVKLKADCQLNGKDEKTAEKNFLSTELPKLLSINQYEKILNIKNTNDAVAEAAGMWREMENKGLTSSMDSTSVLKSITNYCLVKRNARDRYANDKEKLSSTLRTIDDTMPASVRLLYTARKRNIAVEQKAKASFVW